MSDRVVSPSPPWPQFFFFSVFLADLAWFFFHMNFSLNLCNSTENFIGILLS